MILERLKAETAQHHARAEACLPLFDDGLTLDRYRDTLAAMYGFYRPVEERLAAVAGPWAAQLPGRRKAHLLARDLRALGPGLEADLPLCDDLPRLARPADALGCLYVLEGATLGGQLIRRHLGRTLGVGAERGCAFFTSYGDRVGPMWKEFRGWVTSYVAERGEADAVVGAAGETFDALTRWLARRLAPR